MQSRTRTALTIVLSVVVVIAVVAIFALAAHPAGRSDTPGPSGTPSASTTPTTPVVTPSQTPTATPPAAFDKSAHSLTDPASDWVLVNKKNPLNPRAYAPPLETLNLPGRYGQMRPEAAVALRRMFAAYHAQSSSGDQLSVVSPYRSYASQVSVYNGWVTRLGKAQADRQSARPGFSEHQTGLAVDIDTAIDQRFGTTPAGSWLAANSWKFGFIVRYQDGQEKITGYEYEPWHFRYVGVPLATELHKTGTKSLEAFFGYPAAPTY